TKQKNTRKMLVSKANNERFQKNAMYAIDDEASVTYYAALDHDPFYHSAIDCRERLEDGKQVCYLSEANLPRAIPCNVCRQKILPFERLPASSHVTIALKRRAIMKRGKNKTN